MVRIHFKSIHGLCRVYFIYCNDESRSNWEIFSKMPAITSVARSKRPKAIELLNSFIKLKIFFRNMPVLYKPLPHNIPASAFPGIVNCEGCQHFRFNLRHVHTI